MYTFKGCLKKINDNWDKFNNVQRRLFDEYLGLMIRDVDIETFKKINKEICLFINLIVEGKDKEKIKEKQNKLIVLISEAYATSNEI